MKRKNPQLSKTYRNARVLLTGDTGFKGAWLAWWLNRLGARVHGVALPPEFAEGPFLRAELGSLVDHTDGDLRREGVADEAVRRAKPRFVFHLAAQPVVRASYEDPVGTLDTNIMGTARVLDAVRRHAPGCVVVVVTSDKCYENHEWDYSYRENDPMGGHDIYSASKGCAELVVSSYRRSFSPSGECALIASARAGNVHGPGDWTRDRLVPDAITAIRAGRKLVVRNPGAVRPWQHVLEPLSGYLWLGSCLAGADGARFAGAWNFGPGPESARTVADVVELALSAWGGGSWHAKRDPGAPHEANFLSLNIDKTSTRLGWRPAWNFETGIGRTVRGYRTLLDARNAKQAREFMDAEIDAYTEAAGSAGSSWTV